MYLWVVTKIEDIGGEKIGEAMKNNSVLTSLYLQRNNCEWYFVLYKILVLWIGNNIGESGAKVLSEALKKNTALTKLDLFSWNIWSSNGEWEE